MKIDTFCETTAGCTPIVAKKIAWELALLVNDSTQCFFEATIEEFQAVGGLLARRIDGGR